MGFFLFVFALKVTTCQRCEGDGRIVTDYCLKCGGKGSIRSKRNMEVIIPPGVDNGATMQLRGEGNLDKSRSTFRLQLKLYYVLFPNGCGPLVVK